jgi:hypothetical protein
MKMALQIGGTTVIDNSRNLVNIAGGTVPNATNLTGTGTSSINSSALATGTANSTTYLRGDRTWQTIPASTPTTAQVLSATAAASVNAVGTYAFLQALADGAAGPGDTRAGSSLSYSNGRGRYTGTPSGTWRCMGYASLSTTAFSTNDSSSASTLWLRIS